MPRAVGMPLLTRVSSLKPWGSHCEFCSTTNKTGIRKAVRIRRDQPICDHLHNDARPCCSQLVLIRGLIPSKQRQKTKCPPTCSSVKTSAMAGDWQILRPLPPHLPLIPSNEFMPEIQGKKRAPTGLPSRFQVSLGQRS